MQRVGIIGLGYVGLPLAVAFAEEGLDVVAVEVSELGRLENRVVDWDVDLSGPGEQLRVSANTLHVALAMPEDEAERTVKEVLG